MIVLLLISQVIQLNMIDLNIKIDVKTALFLKNPNSSDLGKRIISGSIYLIDELGFEKFTFRKLSKKINSPESSIYRYFENKHNLLVYLTNWYWSWVEYKIVLATINVNNIEEKLNKAIDVLTMPVFEDESISFVNEIILNRIIIEESVKAFHTKEIDEENKKGYFSTYKKMVNRVATMVLDVNPDFRYPHMLITTVIEGAHQQRYFSKHLPRLTNLYKEEDSIVEFYKRLVNSTVKK